MQQQLDRKRFPFPKMVYWYWPVGLTPGGCTWVPVVLVVLEQKGGEDSSKAFPAVIVQTAVSFHQPSHKEHSSSNFLLHGDSRAKHSKLKSVFLKKYISSDNKTHVGGSYYYTKQIKLPKQCGNQTTQANIFAAEAQQWTQLGLLSCFIKDNKTQTYLLLLKLEKRRNHTEIWF